MTSIAAVQTRVEFPAHPDSVQERPFIPDIYLQRAEEGIEIGFANRRGRDYAWAVIPWAKLEAALALLKLEDVFDA